MCVKSNGKHGANTVATTQATRPAYAWVLLMLVWGGAMGWSWTTLIHMYFLH